ncbi:ABC transporter substrate-binding protein [Rhodobaculum claviforme]|uniref:Alpha-glucoside ABC transporter substrate-binding protein n=1 Tax=Rhodobaculum claviforme TaxID=1549854 RepID=A0A934TMG0_9RHOB|nr:ABC transporter substrate-binding protein [Rhodobaculum claviforme]MBK5928239.1 alpha-glucoside ABC transporter substrate-binding protein [Rhodobaculum claviforme]
MPTRRLAAGTAALALIATTAPAQELFLEPGADDRFSWHTLEAFADAHDHTGARLSVAGVWTGADARMVESVLAYFAHATGAEVSYSGSDGFEQDIVISARSNSAPNIAVFPQPGLAADMAARGLLTPLADGTEDWVRATYAAGDSWADLGRFVGPDGEAALYGLFYKVDVKSLVWYSTDAFFEMGYDVPDTMEDLLALTQRIVDDGGTPWCIGLGSGAATGWPATDWVEDLLLRIAAPEVYDGWIDNSVPFDDPRVIEAIELYGHFARNDDFVSGGAQAVATTDWRDAPSGLFRFPPDCHMHKQASFIPTFFPDGLEYGLDYDFFYFPAYARHDLGEPVMGAGTMWAITDDAPVAQSLIAFLQTPIAHELWMAQSGFLTPHTGVNLDTFSSDAQRGINEVLLDATVFRFDASDLMPGEIGAGAFWSGMVDFTTGADAADVAAEIQSRWDAMR